MSVATAAVARLQPAQHTTSRLVIARHVAGSALRWAVVWGFVFGLYVVATAQAFMKGYPSAASRVQLANSLQSFVMLLGQSHHLNTVAGFTTWRVMTAAALIGGIWGLRTSTALLRGEEEAGRWELLVAGSTTRRQATAQALLGLAVSLLAMFVVTTVLILAAGRLPGARFSPDGSVLFAAAMISGAAMFLFIGALASQISRTGGQAAILTTGALAVSYVIRIVADSSASTGWIRWLTPLGWIEEIRPMENPQPLALIPIVGLSVLSALLAIELAGRRDLNASVLREDDGSAGTGRWLVGPISLTVRVSRVTYVAWLVAIGGYSVLFGLVQGAETSILSGSPAFVATLGRLGIHRAAEAFLAMAFLLAAILIAFIAASQIVSLRDEEASGRLDNLLVQPLARSRWLLGRLAISTMLIALSGIAGGVFTWLGGLNQHTGVGLGKLLEAGLNASVPGVFVLGVTVLVFGVQPRFTAATGYGLVAYSFFVAFVAAVMKGADWLRDSSIFTHIAAAPAANPDWGTDLIIVAVGVAAAIIGAFAFTRRDVQYA